MGALLPIPRDVPPKLYEPPAAAMQADGADCLPGGGEIPGGGAKSDLQELGLAGSVSAGRDFRARLADGDRTAGGKTGPAAGEELSASGEPPAGAPSGTRAALVIHLLALSRP